MSAYKAAEDQGFNHLLMPGQFYDSRGVSADSGEKKLLLAILEDAIDCALSGNKTFSGQVQKTALEWIASRDKEWIFSFENICSELGLHAGRLRNGILRKQERGEHIPIIPERTGEIVRVWCNGCHAIVQAELLKEKTALGVRRYYECFPRGHEIKKLLHMHRKK